MGTGGTTGKVYDGGKTREVALNRLTLHAMGGRSNLVIYLTVDRYFDSLQARRL